MIREKNDVQAPLFRQSSPFTTGLVTVLISDYVKMNGVTGANNFRMDLTRFAIEMNSGYAVRYACVKASVFKTA